MEKVKKALAIVLQLVFGMAIGLLLAWFFMESLAGIQNGVDIGIAVGVFLVQVLLATMLQIILHEGGHLIFGRLTGYRFLSFRVGSFMVQRRGEKLTLFRFKLAGTGGQCLMDPPGNLNDNFPFWLYNFGGAILNFLVSGLGLLLAVLTEGFAADFGRILAFIGIVLGLMNAIPMKLGLINNDGHNALSIAKSPMARRAFWIQLKVNAELASGKQLREMPEEWFQYMDWFEKDEDKESTNSLVSYILILAMQRSLNDMDFETVYRIMADIEKVEYALPGIYKQLVAIDRIYLDLVTVASFDADAVRSRIDKPLTQFMKSMSNYPAIIRTQIAIARLLDGNLHEEEKLRNRFEQVSRQYPFPAEIDSERQLIILIHEKASSITNLSK